MILSGEEDMNRLQLYIKEKRNRHRRRMTVKENLKIYFKDTENSFYLQSDGTWKKSTGKKQIRAQEELFKKYKAIQRALEPIYNGEYL